MDRHRGKHTGCHTACHRPGKLHGENETPESSTIDLVEIPAKRLQVGFIDLRAAVDSAREQFQQENVEALCIRGITAPGSTRIYGVLTRQHFKNLYSV